MPKPPGSARLRRIAGIGPTGRISQVNVAVHQLAQSQTMGQSDRQDQPGIGYQAVIVESDLDAIRTTTPHSSLRWIGAKKVCGAQRGSEGTVRSWFDRLTMSGLGRQHERTGVGRERTGRQHVNDRKAQGNAIGSGTCDVLGAGWGE